MSNFISASLTQLEWDEIMDLLNQVEAKLKFNVNLTKDQLEDIPKLADGRLPFTQKSLVHGRQEPKIVAPVNDLTEFQKDIDFYTSAGPLEKKLERISLLLSTGRVAAGSDAYTTALGIYNSAQQAAKQGLPGAQAIVDDLKSLFEGQGVKKTDKKTT